MVAPCPGDRDLPGRDGPSRIQRKARGLVRRINPLAAMRVAGHVLRSALYWLRLWHLGFAVPPRSRLRGGIVAAEGWALWLIGLATVAFASGVSRMPPPHSAFATARSLLLTTDLI